MSTRADGPITELLRRARQGDSAAQTQIGAVVYQQLYAMAHRLTGRQAEYHTLHPTALVNQAYVQLLESGAIERAPNRGYFFAAAARAMRQILADHARQMKASKRGGQYHRMALDDVLQYLHEKKIDTLSLTEALDQLEARDPRKAEVVQLRFFAGFTMCDIAEYLGLSRATVELEWRTARAFLRLRLQ